MQGCELSKLQNSGLTRMLAPLSKPVAPGSTRVYLTSAYHRAALQVCVCACGGGGGEPDQHLSPCCTVGVCVCGTRPSHGDVVPFSQRIVNSDGVLVDVWQSVVVGKHIGFVDAWLHMSLLGNTATDLLKKNLLEDVEQVFGVGPIAPRMWMHRQSCRGVQGWIPQ